MQHDEPIQYCRPFDVVTGLDYDDEAEAAYDRGEDCRFDTDAERFTVCGERRCTCLQARAAVSK